VHNAEPESVLYVLNPHDAHVPPLDPVNPGLQIQAVLSVCPNNACAEFNAQAVQIAVPAVFLYSLGPHAVHVVVILVTVHFTVKPLLVSTPSDVNNILNKPVSDV
jgi:hypothetical protein